LNSRLIVSQEQARRFLIRRQQFLAYGGGFFGPDGVAAALSHLEAVQIDPLCTFERNHHQVLFNRVRGYRPEWLDLLLYQSRGAFEYYCNALCVLPLEDWPLFQSSMRQKQESVIAGLDREMLQAIEQVREHIRQQGETSSIDFQSGRKVYGWWESSQDKNPRTATEKQISDVGVMVLNPAGKPPSTKIEKQALDYLHLTGQVLISRRSGNQRSYDLPQRIVPPELLSRQLSEAESQRRLLLKYLRGYGLGNLGQPGFRFGWYTAPKAAKKRLLLDLVDQGEVTPISIEGLARTYYCPTELVLELTSSEPLPETDTAVILGPLDNLLWDRDRLDDLWQFNYRWEVYTPAAKRRYGYYVVPVLWGERFVGRIELRADRTAGVLRVDNLWFEPQGEAALPAIQRAVRQQADYLGLETVTWAQ
jgi:uncharacterized protein YcaQ